MNIRIWFIFFLSFWMLEFHCARGAVIWDVLNCCSSSCPHPVSVSPAPPVVGRTGLLTGSVETRAGTLVAQGAAHGTFVLFTSAETIGDNTISIKSLRVLLLHKRANQTRWGEGTAANTRGSTTERLEMHIEICLNKISYLSYWMVTTYKPIDRWE